MHIKYLVLQQLYRITVLMVMATMAQVLLLIINYPGLGHTEYGHPYNSLRGDTAEAFIPHNIPHRFAGCPESRRLRPQFGDCI
jgi:hypothetical protein